MRIDCRILLLTNYKRILLNVIQMFLKKKEGRSSIVVKDFADLSCL